MTATVNATVNATVTTRERVSHDTAIIRVVPDGAMPVYQAGQHITLGVETDGVIVDRLYSIASAPSDPYVEFYLHDPPSGRVLLGNHGSGRLTYRQASHSLMIATGTGIAPFISMLRAHQPRNVTLVHGVRHVDELAYRAFLQAAPITYLPVVSREDWPGRKGRVQSVLNLAGKNRELTHVYLCGSSEMVADVEVLVRGEGFAHVHLERY